VRESSRGWDNDCGNERGGLGKVFKIQRGGMGFGINCAGTDGVEMGVTW